MKAYKEYGRLINSVVTGFVGLILLFIIVGGCFLIVHNASWSMDDACMIQSKVGSGKPTHVYDYPGFQPKEGRLFPLAYFHSNLVLLFTRGDYCSARPFYVLNAFLWVLFVVELFVLVYLLLKEKFHVDTVNAKCVSIMILLVFCQRALANFTCLWTTMCIDDVLTVSFCLMFFLSVNNSKASRVFAVFSMLFLLYLTFCLEVNAIIPLMVGIGLLFSRRKFDTMSIICLLIFVLFVALYTSFILFHTEKYYDASHGSTDTILTNLIKELLLHKLLIIMFLVFVYRFVVVIVLNKKFDEFSDTLLLSGITYTIGCFVMRLHGVYYIIPLLLSLPAMVSVLRFETKTNRVLSYLVVFLITGYHVVKYPKMCKAIYLSKEKDCQEMAIFADKLENENEIAWYAEKLESGNMENEWLKGHLVANLRHLKKDKDFQINFSNRLSSADVLLVPKGTHAELIKERFPDVVFTKDGEFAGMEMYRVE